MTTTAITVQGIVTPEGNLTVSQKISLPAGPVQITIEPATESKSAQKDWWQQLQDARAVLEARGTAFRSEAEIEAEREAFRTVSTLPPERHPFDPYKEDIDPIGFALARLQTLLIWIEEHRASFEVFRHTDSASAENELGHLKNSTDQAMAHLQRLKELLLAGCTIDPNKRLPKGLSGPHPVASAMIERLQKS